MRKLKVEKVSGIVALSYLVLIPAGAFYVWRKIQEIDDDVALMWEKLDLPPTDRPPIFDLERLKVRLFG